MHGIKLDKDHYFAGDQVSGVAYVEFAGDLSSTPLVLDFKGEETTRIQVVCWWYTKIREGVYNPVPKIKIHNGKAKSNIVRLEVPFGKHSTDGAATALQPMNFTIHKPTQATKVGITIGERTIPITLKIDALAGGLRRGQWPPGRADHQRPARHRRKCRD